MLVGVDLKEVHDANGERHVFLNILDVATRYSIFVRVDSKSSQEIAESFVQIWTQWAGVPEQIIHDQGGEFFRHFGEMLKKLGIGCHITATEAPWQNGMVERHGQVLAEILASIPQIERVPGDRQTRLQYHIERQRHPELESG